tara:strand:- start:2172 stop:3137 length:966 start_codon:yes stop_codon:yes gene_type:complete
MSCGLGAVALMLIFIKTNSDPSNSNINEITSQLEVELKNIEKINSKNNIIIAKKETEIQSMINEIETLNKKIVLAENLSKISDQTAKNLKEKIKSKPVEIVKNVSQIKGYLSGCNVKGKNVGLFLDSSGSMSDKNLVDILRYKASSQIIQINAPKWKQAKEIFRWLFKKTSDSTNIIALTFSSTINYMKKELKTSKELKQSDEFKSFLDDLVPANGTNLKQLISVIEENNLDSIYIITDGFPTLPISEDKKCEDKNVISPKCRKKLFINFSNSIRSLPNKPSLNFIIMPLEGDYSSRYWFSRLAMDTNGCFITAGKDWLAN